MKNTVIGGRGARVPVATILDSQELQDSSWLDINHFPNINLGFKYSAFDDQYRKTGVIEDKPGPNNAKDGQSEDGLEGIDHNMNWSEDGFRDEDGVEYGGEDFEDFIADPELDRIKAGNGDRSNSKGGHGAGTEGDNEGFY